MNLPVDASEIDPGRFMPSGRSVAFVRGSIEVNRARVAHSKLAREASDHLPLVIDFRLRGDGPDS